MAEAREPVTCSGRESSRSNLRANKWTIRVPSHSGDGPTLGAGQLRLPLLLLAEDPRIIQFVFYEDEESGQDEGETASAKVEYHFPKVAGSVGGGERSKLMAVEESNGERV